MDNMNGVMEILVSGICHRHPKLNLTPDSPECAYLLTLWRWPSPYHGRMRWRNSDTEAAIDSDAPLPLLCRPPRRVDAVRAGREP